VKKRSIWWLLPLFLLGGALAGTYFWFRNGTQPMPSGEKFYIRYRERTPLEKVLNDLHQRGVVRSVDAFKMYARLKQISPEVGAGTYQLQPGMGAPMIFAQLRKPVRQMVRIPETNWARRTANLLEKKYNVGKAEEYMELVHRPAEFKDDVSFPLPAFSLEGYLFPDTYDLPPLMTSREVIQRQLKAFEKKVWQGLNKPKYIERILTLASLVELEAGTDEDRPMIAGVVENRLKRGMRLQIDATILYGMQEWRRLTYADYRNQKHPYNTYLIDGLPPGPICSPSVASIKAVMKPAKHDYLYYVALPDGTSIFGRTYEEHKANIRKRRRALAEAGE